MKSGRAVLGYDNRQTYRHTYTQIAILCTRTAFKLIAPREESVHNNPDDELKKLTELNSSVHLYSVYAHAERSTEVTV